MCSASIAGNTCHDTREWTQSLIDHTRAHWHLEPMLIYKIFRAPEWAAMQTAGETRGAPVDLADGYIHFSTAAQVRDTAAKWFADEDNLYLLALESDTLAPHLKWEPARGGSLFPHLYRALSMTDILWAKPLPLGPDGHIFPDLS